MAKKLKIQVEFESIKESLSKIGADLDKAFNSKVELFTPEMKQDAQNLKTLINNTLSGFEEADSKGRISKNLIKMLKESFETAEVESKKLGTNLSRNLKVDPLKFFTPEQLTQVKGLNDEIMELKGHLDELKKKSLIPNFQDIYKSEAFAKMPGSEEIRLGKVQNIDKAEDEIKKRIEELQAKYDKNLKGKKGLGDERKAAQEEINLYKYLQTEIQKARAVQIAAENDVQAEVLETTSKISEKIKEIDKVGQEATQSGKEIAEGLKTESKNIEQNLTGMKWKEAIGIDGGIDVFGGFIEGVTGKVKGFVTGITSGVIILNTMRRIFNDTIKTIKDLDKAFNDIAIVTTYTTEEVWQMKDAFVGIANTAGMSVIEVTNIANEFFRQGRSLSETLQLTEAAGIAAKVAGIDAKKSVDYLTSAINGYKLSASQAMAVSDKFAALAAGSATDYEELAIALSKVAAQAYSAGVNMDNMMGFIAKALETTREAPENIGTAFKTIFARMSELKDYGKTLEDGMDVNRIDKALKSIGVNLTDQANELRNLDEVLIEVGYKWTSLTKNQKAYITTALAGTRQQTRLLAIFEDFDRTMELTELSANSLGATFAQQEKYYNSIAYAQNQLTVAWQNFVSSLGSSSLFIGVFNILSGSVNVLNNLNTTFKELGPVVTTAIGAFGLLTFAMVAYNKSMMKSITIQLMASGLSKKRIAEKLAEASANFTLSASYTKLTTAATGAAVAMFTTYLPITLLVAAIAGLSYVMVKAINKNKDFVKSMRTTQSELFNLRQEAQQLDELITEYEDIEMKVNISAADITRQEELIRQIQDLVGEEVSLFNIEGEFDLEKAKNALTSTQEAAENKFKELRTKAISEYQTVQKAYSATLDQSTKDALILQQIIDSGHIESYEKFLTLSKKEREELKKTAKLQLELNSDRQKYVFDYTDSGKSQEQVDAYIQQVYDSYSKLDNPERQMEFAMKAALAKGYITKFKLVPELDEAEIEKATKTLESLFAANFEDISLQDQIGELIKSDFKNWGEDVTKNIAEVVPSVKGIQSLMEQLNTDSLEDLYTTVEKSGKTTEQIYKLNEVIGNLDLEQSKKTDLFKNLLESGTNTFQGLQNYIDDYNVGFFEAISLTQQLKDALSEVSFEKISDSIASIRSVDENLSKVNAMLSGEEAYDISFMREMIELYPEIGNAIRANTELSQESIKTIMDGEQAALETSIDNQIASLETDIANNELKIAAYENMLTIQTQLDELRGEDSKTLEQMTLTELEDLYNQYLQKKTTGAFEANRLIAEQNLALELGYQNISQEEYNSRLAAIRQHAAEMAGVVNNAFIDTTSQPAVETFSTKIQTAIDQLKANNQTLRDQISNLQFLKNNIDKVTKATNASTKEAEKYKAALDEIYIITQQLATIQSKLDQYEFMEEHAKSGEEYLTAIYSQNAALKTQVDVTKKLIDAQKRSQDAIYNSLGNLKGSVEVIEGRLYPVMSKYLRLTEEQQKIIDENVEAYNDLSDSIDDNSMSMEENIALIEENLQKIEDKTVEFYDILAEAIKNSEKKKLDELKKGFEAERKLLDERRKMYEDAFAEEDYTDSLKEVTDERADIISQLTELEGASDLASVTKRKDLLNRKAELDKEYNKTVLDYNRDALLELFDEESELIDQREQEYEEAYEDRINSVEWLESEISRIMNDGLDSTIQYLKDHSPEYEDAWTITKDNIQGKWEMLYDVINGKVDEIEKNIPDFTNLLAQLAEAARLVGQINAKPTNPDGPGGPPNTGGGKRTVYVYNGKEYDYQRNAEAVKTNDMIQANNEINRLNTAVKNAKSYAQAVALGTQLDQAKATFKSISDRKITTKQYKKGGLSYNTGLAWLDGTKSKPERVLSAVQTELFDKMVQNLEDINSKPGNQTNTSNSSISIENITITTGQLNTSQDFREAGRSIAQEFKNAITERGLNINLKR